MSLSTQAALALSANDLLDEDPRRITLSSESPNWCTPQEVLDPINEFAGADGIYLDPFSNPHSLVKACKKWELPDHDALALPWPVLTIADLPYNGMPPPPGSVQPSGGYITMKLPPPPETSRMLCYANTPYGRWLSRCAAKIRQEAERGAEILALLPNSTGTAWWRDMRVSIWCAWHKRISFLEPEQDLLRRYEERSRRKGRTCPPPKYHRVTDTLVVTDQGATFDSALVYFGPRKGAFCDIFSKYGDIWTRPW